MEARRLGTIHRPDRIPDRNQWNDWRHNQSRQRLGSLAQQLARLRSLVQPAIGGITIIATIRTIPISITGAMRRGPALTGWVGYGWNQPVYYNYGDNVYYEADQVYYGDQPVATAEEYAEQAAAIVASVPATKPAAEIGCRSACSRSRPMASRTTPNPTMYLQLAVSKQGVLSGTLQNVISDSVHPISRNGR